MQKRIFTLLLFFLSVTAYAQQSMVGCNDKAIRLQSEQLKNSFKAQGLSVMRDAMLNMESRQPYPVAVQLVQGRLYQFIYVGDRHASRIELELFDGNDKLIDKKIIKDPSTENQVIYSFVPEKSDIYLIVLNQRWKTHTMCGSLTIMEKKEEAAKPE